MTDQDARESHEGQGGGSLAPAKPAERKSPQHQPPKVLPPWKVMLHNDDVNDFDDVIKIVHHLTPLSKQESRVRALEAHESGVAMLLVTHRERAELYVEQFTSAGLTATCEPDA